MGEAREVMDRVTEAAFSGDADALGRLYADDAVAETPDEGTLRGRDAIVTWLMKFDQAFPDASFELTAGHEAGDAAIDEGYLNGTNSGSLPMPGGQTLPATGRTVRIRACDVATVRDGLVTSHHFYYDQMEFLEQLGLAPEA